MNEADIILAAMMGISLAAASGFRVFLPPFLLSLAVRSDFIELDLAGTSFEYFDTNIAVILLGVATVVEFAAFYIPWVDNLLDTIASPAAVIAGASMTAIVLTGSDPIVQWTIAIIAGGGVAGVIQTATVATRGLSTALTLGTANPIVATAENIASVALTIVALLAPLLAGIFAILIIFLMVRRWVRSEKQTNPA